MLKIRPGLAMAALVFAATPAYASPAFIQQVEGAREATTSMLDIVGSLGALASVVPAPATRGGTALIIQDGAGNQATISQRGGGSSALVYQIGANNLAAVTQIGAGHRALVAQQGRNNVAVIRQR